MPRSSLRSGKTLEGILPAIVSPHDGRDRFDAAAFEKQAHFLYEAGVHGLYVCGGTGEGYLMRLDERKSAAEIAVRASGGIGHVIVHVGAQAARDAIELSEHAAKIGAAAIASIPPIGRDYKELLTWYRDLTLTGLPTFVYHIPGLTGQSLTVG